MKVLPAVAGGVGVLGAAHALPAAACWPALRAAVAPSLAGIGAPGHVALTFDDGPDRRSTPQFLRLLRARGIRATFFLLGGMARGNGEVAEAIVADGHEIALHGYQHRCLLLRGPRATYDDLARGRDAVARATGVVPRWWRPPYGVLSTAALAAAARLELTPVLWTAWGRDWSARASVQSVHRIVTRDLRSGGTVLLHDSDCTSAPGSWRTTLAALPGLLDHCAGNGWRVGPLAQHAVPGAPAGAPALAGVEPGVPA
jgi:peptidoglycan-N-acetylglucosamine deacetylase